MEPRHALRAGAAACPAVEAEGLTGNTARGKAFQGGHIRLIIALRAVGVEEGRETARLHPESKPFRTG